MKDVDFSLSHLLFDLEVDESGVDWEVVELVVDNLIDFEIVELGVDNLMIDELGVDGVVEV